MTQNTKKTKTQKPQMRGFVQNRKKMKMEIPLRRPKVAILKWPIPRFLGESAISEYIM